MNIYFFDIKYPQKFKFNLKNHKRKMNEKITVELFSSIVSKINQIPNYTTPHKKNPSLKENQKLNQLYHTYNIDIAQREIFFKIFSNIYDYNLRKNLVKIMLNIGTKFNSFSVSDTNTTSIKDANTELMTILADLWNYFSEKSEYLKNIELEEFQYASDEYIEYDKMFNETLCFSCGLINIIIFMFKKQFSVLDNFSNNINLGSNTLGNNNKIVSNLSKELVQTELNMLFIINKNRIWLEHLITLLEYIFKFISSNSSFYRLFNMKIEKHKKRQREGLISKGDIIQEINSYINYLIDDKNVLQIIFTLVVKYNALNNINILTGSIIPIKDLNIVIQRFFNIYVLFLMNQNFLSDYSTDEQIFCLGINIIESLLNSKYKDPNYGIDFVCFFYSMENFLNEIFDKITVKIINGITEINALLKASCLDIKMPNLNLLQKLENTLRDYVLFTFVSSFNKDSLCDLYQNYVKHRQIFQTFGILRSYLLIYKSIQKSENYYKYILTNIDSDAEIIEKKKQILIGNIFEDLLNELRKYSMVFPIRMFLYKSYILQSVLIVLHKFVKLFDKYILSANNDKIIFYNNISIIKEMSESVNSLFFLIGNDILKSLKFPADFKKKNKDTNKQIINPVLPPSLRIIDESNIMNYITITQEKIPNTAKANAQSKKLKYEMPQMNSSIINKINHPFHTKPSVNIFGNSSIFNSNQKPKNNPFGSLFHSNFNDNMKIDFNDDNINNDNKSKNISLNKNGYTIIPSNIFKSNIIRSEVKNRNSLKLAEYFYRYDITNYIDSIKKELLNSLNENGYEYKMENGKHYIYINQEEIINPNICEILYFGEDKIKGMSLNNTNMYHLINNEPLTKLVNEQLYMTFLDGVDDSNKGKNIKSTLKYYDFRFNIDYFTFIEKCKRFIC